MTAVVLRGDARRLPLPDASVDLIMCSPPYFGLRDYRDGEGSLAGQIGSEATPAEWVAALVECTREWVRVLKPSGSIFVNLGDKYAGSDPGRRDKVSMQALDHRMGRLGASQLDRAGPTVAPKPASWGAPNKSLLGLPWRYALACTDQLGLILHRDIIWAKPNGLPESVTDRCRSSHEYLFHLTKSPRYYAAVDEIREPHIQPEAGRWTRPADTKWQARSDGGDTRFRAENRTPNPLGKLPGSVWKVPPDDTVWEIPSAPLTVPPHLGVDHFAAYPCGLVRPVVLGWSPPGICVACGEGRRPVRGVDWSKVPHTMVPKRVKTHAELAAWGRALRAWRTAAGISRRDIADLIRPDFATDESATAQLSNWENAYNWPEVRTWERIEAQFSPPAHLCEEVRHTTPVPVSLWEIGDGNGTVTGRHNTPTGGLSSANYQAITGYVCACPQPTAPTRPAIVLDPFCGTGTTLLVASVYGRTGIGVDLSSDYCRLARWRVADPAERVRALQVPKPPPIPDGMDALF